ncbi:hypothetical protein D9613_003448 [Agrocybe pediades]|uniref:G domain-containing protein n=1 Tax=Agrocybe pediades TaxID=84607 RepID=A0A8H4QP02_9AGAR|nr:hypothetical protein D9613_003448 [Agrocybe pediades]
MNKPDIPIEQSSDSKLEIIIPVMGATGAGKSTFLNYLVQDEALKCPVGHGLASCTVGLRSIPLIFPNDELLKHYKITLVDTPGFDDTNLGDAAILRLIADWLAKAYRDKKVLGGVIYLHDVSNKRFSGTARRNLEMFNLMCGDHALSRVVFGTTNWTRITEDRGVRSEDELEGVHWRSMLEQGARTKRFEDSYESAFSFIKDIIGRALVHVYYFKIQKEMVDDKKIIAETDPGKKLLYTVEDVADMRRQLLHLEKATENVDAFEEIHRKLKVPLLRRLWKYVTTDS